MILSLDDRGIIYIRRMVRDFRDYALAVEHGRRGGNPSLPPSSEAETPETAAPKGAEFDRNTTPVELQSDSGQTFVQTISPDIAASRWGPHDLAVVQAKGAASRRLAADQFAANVLPIIRQIQGTGFATLAGLAEALNARGGVVTAQGGRWHAMTVRNMAMRGAGVHPGHEAA